MHTQYCTMFVINLTLFLNLTFELQRAGYVCALAPFYIWHLPWDQKGGRTIYIYIYINIYIDTGAVLLLEELASLSIVINHFVTAPTQFAHVYCTVGV